MRTSLAVLAAAAAAAAAAPAPAAASAGLAAPLTCGGAPSAPSAGPSYAVTLDGAPLFSNPPPLNVFMGGAWATGGWVVVSAANVSDADGIGAYTGVDCTYAAAAAPAVPFLTVSAYTYAAPTAAPAASAVRFRYTFLTGAASTNHSAPAAAAGSTVSTFPAFAGPGTPLPNVLTWRGPFFSPSSTVTDMFDQQASVAVFYGGDVAGRAVVLAPLDGFLNAALGDDLGPGAPACGTSAGGDAGCWAAGLSASVTSVPPGFTQSFLLTAASGIAGTVDAWGRVMRAFYGATSTKMADTSLTTLGYNTDNGAQLCFGCDGPLDTCLLAEKAYLDGLKVPIQWFSFQNAWWEMGGESAPWCVGEWVPNPKKVPMGVQAFQKALGLPLQLYAPYFCATSAYPSNFTMVRSDTTLPGCSDFDFFDAAPESSRLFYEFLLGLGRDYGMTMFEPDFLNANHLCVRRFIEEIGAADGFFEGQAGVALDMGIPIQWCFTTPLLLLWTLGHPSVTNFRVSLDYYYGRSWDIGRSSLLVWAAGGRPSKDTFWTTDNGNQSTTRGGCDKTGCPPDHSAAGAVLHTMLAVLTTGPVAFSDAPGETDPVLIGRTCDAAGNLLQPSKPLTAVDSTHDVTPGAAPSGYALVAHTAVGGGAAPVALWMVVSHSMARGSPVFTVRGLDLWPSLPVGAPVAVTTWAALQACAGAGGACRGNVSTLSGPADPHAALFPLPPPAAGEDPITPTLTLLAPVCAGSGVAVFGEIDKFAPVSVQRFTSLACTPSGASATLSGVGGEAVRLGWWAPGLPGGAGVAFGTATMPGTGPARAAVACSLGANGQLACA
jgi:hypothetical protein